MTYPASAPKSKHDLSCSSSLPDFPASLISQMGFANSAELFRGLDEPLDPNFRPHKIGFVYSYSDAPDFPGPLSRSLMVLGVADTSLSLVRRVLNQEELPDCLHKCTIAVQLADSRHMARLEPRHQRNSRVFSRFMKQLRKDEAVGIVAKDKHGRFAMLAPMGTASSVDDDPSIIAPEDCAAFCYVGVAKEVMEYLASNTSIAADETTSNGRIASRRDNSDTTWKPPGAETPPTENGTGLWHPPDASESHAFARPWIGNDAGGSEASGWNTGHSDKSGEASAGVKRSFEQMNRDKENVEEDDAGDSYHTDSGAAAADAFYSGLTRSLDTRADSYLYHMRAFNGWVKATQIQELDPVVSTGGKVQPRAPLRVLDLACGKGGDLTKWSLHARGVRWYVGIDVARGSLKDAAIRAREMRKKNKLSQAIFTVADLGADVPGRKKSSHHKGMQSLLTWSLQDESPHESAPPEFKMKRGGGIREDDRFDVVSIQFAIHYMMSNRRRALRFFHTVSELLEVGGNLICTTIDARVVVDHLMNLGHDYHFQRDAAPDFTEAIVEAGAGACKIRFEPQVVKQIITSTSSGINAEEELFGLQYTFTLVEGSDHAAGVGDAVNLPEWLTPLPVLKALARDAGLELDYAQNFHEFYQARKDPSTHPAAHLALYNMKVLNREGTISSEEWSVSRLYSAIRFRKVRESSIFVDGTQEDDGDNAESEGDEDVDSKTADKLLPAALIKAKKSIGEDAWNALSSEEKKRLTRLQLKALSKKCP